MGVILGLLAGFTYGAADFIGGLASRRSSTLSVVVFSQLVGLIVLFFLAPMFSQAFPGWADMRWGILAGIAGAVGITLLYRGLSIGRMSLVSPVTALIAALIPFAVGLLLRERPSVFALTGIGLALLAVVLVSTTKVAAGEASHAAPPLSRRAAVRNWALQPGLLEAVISGVGVGAFYVLLARTHAQSGLWPLVGARSSSIFLLTAVALIGKRSLVPAREGWGPITLTGILDMLANAFYLLATRHGLLAIVAVLASLYPASTVLLARVLLKEKLRRLQLAGVVCALAAIALIAYKP